MAEADTQTLERFVDEDTASLYMEAYTAVY
jgi:hypothetical protein